jgi:recombination protein RecT
MYTSVREDEMQTQATQNQETSLSKVDPRQMTLKKLLEGSKAALAQVVPKHLTPDRLMKVALMATSRNADLLKCTPHSVLNSIMQAAQVGLEVNSPLGHAYLVPFYNKDEKTNECTLIIGYRGFIDLARRSSEIDTIEARCVYEKDFFELAYGTDQKLIHRPALANRGKLVCVYALARLKDSAMPQIEVLLPEDIEYARSVSKTGSKGWGPWKDRYEEMARKTAVRRLAKYLPLSPELADAMDADDHNDSELPVAAIEVEEVPLRDALKAQAERGRKPQNGTLPSEGGGEVALEESWCAALDESTDIPTLDEVKAQAEQKLTGETLQAFMRLYLMACDRVRGKK